MLLLSFNDFLIAVAEHIELSICSELYSDFILVIVYGFILLSNFIILLMYSIPSILFEELSILSKSSFDILTKLL